MDFKYLHGVPGDSRSRESPKGEEIVKQVFI